MELSNDEKKIVEQLHLLLTLGTSGKRRYDYIVDFLLGSLLPHYIDSSVIEEREEKKIVYFPGCEK